MTGPGHDDDERWPGQVIDEQTKVFRSSRDVVDELKEYLSTYRAGTCDSNVNALLLPVSVPRGLIYKAVNEILLLRTKCR